jgi:hypothetical protein
VNDPYLLPGGALRNLLGLDDPLLLEQADADIAAAMSTVSSGWRGTVG